MSEANKALVRRYIDQIWNQGNLALISEIFSADSVFRAKGQPEIHGLEARRQYVIELRTAFPDIQFRIEELIAEGEKVALCWASSGTHRHAWMRIAATGKPILASGTSMFSIVGGRIAEELVQWDSLGYMQQLGAAPSTEANKALARRYLGDFLNKRDWALADEIFAEDYISRVPNLPEMRGPEAVKQFHMALRASFPDIQFTVLDLMAEDDKVSVRWEGSGTHKGEWMGVAPTGKFVRWSGIDTLRIAGGKIVEEWGEIDSLGFFQQVGAVPAIGRAAD